MEGMEKIKRRKEFSEKYRIKQVVCAILGICISLLLTGTLVKSRMKEVNAGILSTQESLAKEVFRFHVLANSDSEEDQNLKLKVRDAVIAYMKDAMQKEEMQKDAIQKEKMQKEAGEKKKPDAKATKEWAKAHLQEIEQTADQVIRKEGYTYRAEAEVTECYFPDKRYGDILFPEGEYEALRVKLGEAEGQNWWCVLYPNLCFTSTTCAVVDEEGKEELREVLTEDEYEMVTATTEFKIKWFFFGGDRSKED